MLSLIRLVTGDEILADWSCETAPLDDVLDVNGTYLLSKPLRIIAQPAPDGRLQVALGSLTPFGDPDSDVRVHGSKIVFIMNPEKSMIDAYKKTVSPIIQPSGGGIILG